ncbi:MAG TPA: CRISPR-associated protein Csx14 [Thermoplasmataceae archaeon]|nr:CRISPR-associated protein Csx14 [Thermoplasmataceae archaeon]
MKAALINPMGTTPMVATEMVAFLRNMDERLQDVVFICTDSRDVRIGTYAAVGAILSRYPRIRTHIKTLDFEDVADEESLLKFLDVLVDTISEERQFGVNKLYLNVSGGRKVQNIVASLYAGLLGIDEVYNVFDPDLKNFNAKYEEIKDDVLDRFEKTDDYLSAYNSIRDRADHIFFPNLGRLVFLKVGVLQFPESEKMALKDAIKGTDITDGHIEDFKIRAFRDSGFITYDRRRTYSTDLGEIIAKGI